MKMIKVGNVYINPEQVAAIEPKYEGKPATLVRTTIGEWGGYKFLPTTPGFRELLAEIGISEHEYEKYF